MLDYIAANLKNPSFISVFLAYIGGVFASLSPCVYPMIPVILGIIGASKVDSRKRGLMLSLFYALGLALVYSILGIIAAMSGNIFGEISSNPWSYLIFGNLCLLLSFWMLDWITLPTFDVKKKTGRPGLGGAFITGLFSGLVAAPCTSGALGGLLIYVATTKNAVFGGIMLFLFSFGMTSLLIVIGTFSGILKLLPRPGEWMVYVKNLLAVVLIGLAEYFLLKAGGGVIL